MQKIIWGIIAIGFGIQSSLVAVSLETFISHSKTHPYFEKEALDIRLAESDVLSAKASIDWTAALSPSYARLEPASNSVFNTETSQSTSFSSSLSRSFWSTGGQLSLSTNSSYTDQQQPVFNGQSLGSDEFYHNRVALQYVQPLLKNIGGIMSRLPYDMAQYQVDIAKFNSMERQEAFLLGLIQQYLGWVLLNEQVTILKERLRIAEEDLSSTQKKRKSNLVTQVDLIRSEDSVRIAKQNVTLVESKLLSSRSGLAIVLDFPQLSTSTPNFDLETLPTLEDINVLSDKKSSDSRLMTVLDQEMARLRRVQLTYQNELAPELNLVTELGISDGGAEFDEAMDFDKSDISVAINYEFPVENSAARAQVNRNETLLQQIDLSIQSSERDLNAQHEQLRIELTELRRVIDLNREQLDSALRKTTEENKLYSQGRSQLTFLIQAKDGVQNSRLLYAENLAKFHQLYFQYMALKDQLIEGQ